MTARVWPVDAVSGAPAYSGRALRQTSVAPWAPGATPARPLGARSGIRPGSYSAGVPLVAATSTTWTVHPHAGVIDAEAAAEAAPYAYALDADTPGAVTAAHATYARIDLISVRIDDPAEADGTSIPAATVVYTAGVASASPAVPATPARSMALAQINVPISGGGSPTVTMVAPSLPLHIIPVRTATERTALDVTGASTLTPVIARQADEDTLWRHNGTTWARVGTSAWVTYTPTLTNLSVGTGVGSATFQWRYVGGLVEVRFAIVLGTSATMSMPKFTLPVASAALTHGFQIAGVGSMNPSGEIWPTFITLPTSTQAQINYRTSGKLLDPSLVAPLAFASGNSLIGELSYIPA